MKMKKLLENQETTNHHLHKITLLLMTLLVISKNPNHKVARYMVAIIMGIITAEDVGRLFKAYREED